MTHATTPQELVEHALAASGAAGQAPPKLSYPSDLTLNGLSFQTLAEKLQSQLAAAGITIDLAPAPVATGTSRVGTAGAEPGGAEPEPVPAAR